MSSIDVPILLGDQFSLSFWGFLVDSEDNLRENKEKRKEKKLRQFNLPKLYIIS